MFSCGHHPFIKNIILFLINLMAGGGVADCRLQLIADCRCPSGWLDYPGYSCLYDILLTTLHCSARLLLAHSLLLADFT